MAPAAKIVLYSVLPVGMSPLPVAAMKAAIVSQRLLRVDP